MNKLKIFSITFFTFFNLFNIYTYITNTFIEYQYSILVSVAIFEFFNIFMELKQNNKQFVISITHHICAFLSTTLSVLYYDSFNFDLRTSLIKYMCLLLYSNLFLNLQEIFTKNILIKILFATTFLYFRIFVNFSYLLIFINNISLLNDFVVNVILFTVIGFYLLSCYWGILIIKKVYKFLQ